jgi:hypothetical protein
MEISMSIPYAAIPVGAAMMIVELVAEVLTAYGPVDAPGSSPASQPAKE